MNVNKDTISIYMLSRKNRDSAKGVAIFVNEFGVKMFELVLDAHPLWERDYLDFKLLEMILDKCSTYRKINLNVSLFLFEILKSKKKIIEDEALLSKIHSQLLVFGKRLRLGVFTARSVWNEPAKKILSK